MILKLLPKFTVLQSTSSELHVQISKINWVAYTKFKLLNNYLDSGVIYPLGYHMVHPLSLSLM